jgi:hypothetical protein
LLVGRNGRAFVDSVDKYYTGLEAVGDRNVPYLFPSAWWNKAAKDIPPDELDGNDESALELLTLLRNNFKGERPGWLSRIVYSQFIFVV